MNKKVSKGSRVKFLTIIISVLFIAVAVNAAERLPTMPGYEQYQKMSGQMRGVVSGGSLSVTWLDGGKAFEYQKEGKRYRYDIAKRKATEIAGAVSEEPNAPTRGGRGERGGFPTGRGRMGGGRGTGSGRGTSASFVRAGEQMGGGGIARQQTESARSPDGKFNAFSRDGNLYLSEPNGEIEKAITTKGSISKRLRYGIATIIYGEELGMTGGIFWAQDSKKFAYYGFDESQVKDYYVLREQTNQYDSLETDTYPKAGTISPIVYLYIYDVNTGKSIEVDVRDGKTFEDSVIGYYVYRIYWSPDGKELLIHRMNRKQNTLELVAANPQTGKCRVIIREEWPTGWVAWSPLIRFLEDGKRFILVSERNGFRNYYLYDLSGKLLATLTNHKFEVANIVRLDEQAGLLYYTARDGDNYMKLQLHRVGLDGKGEKRMTDPKFNHSINDAGLAPDGKHFIDVAQTYDQPPVTRLVDSEGKVIEELAKSDLTRFNELGLKKVEMFSYKAADGKTDLYGMLHFSSTFDPTKKYPMLLNVYGGPSRSNSPVETFSTPSATTEYGFLIVQVEARSYGDRGKALLDAYYGHLGITEMDDIAAGVRSLFNRPYVDKERVGVYGTSYGGTTSATLLMRYPDVFAAASSSSPVTDYRNYNNIYSERYNGLVSENEAGYDAATIMTYAKNLKGRLMLFYGTADNNVHLSNSMQLIRALQSAGKSFEVQVGPDRGHSGISQDRMMEFFIENLVLRK